MELKELEEKIEYKKTIISYLFFLLSRQELTDFVKTLSDEKVAEVYTLVVGPKNVNPRLYPIVDVIKQEIDYRGVERVFGKQEDKYKNIKTPVTELIDEETKQESMKYLKTVSEYEEPGEKADCTILLDVMPITYDIEAFSMLYGKLIANGMNESELTTYMMEPELSTQMYLSVRDRKNELYSYLIDDDFIAYIRNTAAKFSKKQTEKQISKNQEKQQ